MAIFLRFDLLVQCLYRARAIWEDNWDVCKQKSCSKSCNSKTSHRKTAQNSNFQECIDANHECISRSVSPSSSEEDVAPKNIYLVAAAERGCESTGPSYNGRIANAMPAPPHRPSYAVHNTFHPSEASCHSSHVVAAAAHLRISRGRDVPEAVEPPPSLGSVWPVDELLMLDLPAAREEQGWAPLEQMLPLALASGRWWN
mmetsp:Transcript_27312/g.72041  ORF Transcript_27312/g.72041 Transcript_27312/m.72041 type:complete len:200 (-) Transcript_27312:975-1574(-)